MTADEFAASLDKAARFDGYVPANDDFARAVMALPAGLGCKRARVSDADFTFNAMGLAGRTNGR